MADVIMPKMGDAMTEGKVLTWRKKVGDTLSPGEPIAEIETDKVNVDIEAEEAGTLVEILVGEGQSAPVGAKIAAIGAPGSKPSARPAAAPAKPAPAGSAATKPGIPAAAPVPSAPVPSAPARATPEGPPATAPTTDDRVKASPLAR
ncbi:MAG TPA: biotin/lipoyl-containing protein, partial [Thermoleophilia bacterium]|nr:biotin/lipoyl-containing protein [Thermoleophilia bacterium]